MKDGVMDVTFDEDEIRRIDEENAKQRDMEQKLQGHSETAAKPPALDELLGKIGRKV